MKSNVFKCVFFLCVAIASIPTGLYIDSRVYIVTFISLIWFVHYLVKWLTGEQSKKEPTYKEVFEKFRGGPKDGTA